MKLRPVHIDGALFVAVAITLQMTNTFSADDAGHFIPPAVLWWLKNVVGWGAQGLLALKMYRAQGYARDRKEQETGFTEAGDPVKVEEKTPLDRTPPPLVGSGST